jgi:hypothetical protein
LFLSGLIRRVKQAQTFNFWTTTFEKIFKTLKNFTFLAFFRPFRPGRGHQHSKFCKVVEQKLFPISFRIFKVHSSSQILRISISLHPNAYRYLGSDFLFPSFLVKKSFRFLSLSELSFWQAQQFCPDIFQIRLQYFPGKATILLSKVVPNN